MFHLKVTLQVAAQAKRKEKEDDSQPMNEVINQRMKKYYRLGYVLYGILVCMVGFTVFLIVKGGEYVKLATSRGNYN